MFVQQLGFIELAIIHRSTYNRSVCNSSSTAWRWYSYQQLSSFKVNAKYSTKKFKGVEKVFIITPPLPPRKRQQWGGLTEDNRQRQAATQPQFWSRILQQTSFKFVWHTKFSFLKWLGCPKYIFFFNYKFLIYSRTLDRICCQVTPPMQSGRVTKVALNDLSIVHFTKWFP